MEKSEEHPASFEAVENFQGKGEKAVENIIYDACKRTYQVFFNVPCHFEARFSFFFEGSERSILK